MKKYYVYIYLREDGSPYYVGKGIGRRWKGPHRVEVPISDRVIFPITQTTEEWSHFMEMELIDLYGRLSDGTGILENLTDGGEGSSGLIHSEEHKRKLSEKLMGHDVLDTTREKMSRETSKRFSNGNYVWINNGISQTMIDLNVVSIPEGWNKGRTTNNGMTNHSHTTKEIIGKRSKEMWEQNRFVWVNNGSINRRVLPNEIPEGFSRGRMKSHK